MIPIVGTDRVIVIGAWNVSSTAGHKPAAIPIASDARSDIANEARTRTTVAPTTLPNVGESTMYDSSTRVSRGDGRMILLPTTTEAMCQALSPNSGDTTRRMRRRRTASREAAPPSGTSFNEAALLDVVEVVTGQGTRGYVRGIGAKHAQVLLDRGPGRKRIDKLEVGTRHRFFDERRR